MTTTTTLTTEIEDRTHNKRYIHVYSPTHTHVKRTDAKCYEVLQISTTDLDNDADDDDDVMTTTTTTTKTTAATMRNKCRLFAFVFNPKHSHTFSHTRSHTNT